MFDENPFYPGHYRTNYRRRNWSAWRPVRPYLRFHLLIIKDRFRSKFIPNI